jgi:hypothetical protein
MRPNLWICTALKMRKSLGPDAITEWLPMSKYQSLRPTLGFFLAIIIGRALPYGDFVEREPFRFHPDVGVPRKHGAGDVPGDAHDYLVACTRLSQLRDQRVAVVMPPARYPGLLPDLRPRRLERCDRTRRIFRQRRPEGAKPGSMMMILGR